MIEELRERLGITKAEMISRLGITRNYYSMIANGERPISMKLGIKIRDEFGISLDIIFFSEHVNDVLLSKQKAI
jgi:transcriptional regulator with XRE-family HTH domain